MKRRSFLSMFLASIGGAFSLKAASGLPSMKIVRIETVYWKNRDSAPWWPHWVWVRLETDNGHFGIGETYPRNETEANLLHSTVTQGLLGQDPRNIERITQDLYRQFDYQVLGGTEIRVLSALNLALWDLLGRSLGVPVYQLIGGKSNPRVPVYNTCFPHRYDFNQEPEKIMREVRDGYGIKAIKIWPFDGAAFQTQHQLIRAEDIELGLKPVRKLRDAFGDSIDIMVECHSNWNLPSAIRIARALEPYKPLWLEDALLTANFQQYHELAQATSIPLLLSERLAGSMRYQELIESRAAKYISFDVCWCGGFSEARKIAALAEANHLLIAPHTAGGPLLFYAATHLTTASTNVAIQESCQRFYESDWPKMLENPIIPKDGSVAAPELPGFGMEIKPEVWKHPAAVIQTSALR